MSFQIIGRDELRRSRAQQPAALRINARTGRIALNRAAAQLLRLDRGQRNALLILWDADRRKIALKRAAEGNNAFAVSFAGNGRGSAGISARRFLAGINELTCSRRYNASWDDAEQMIEVNV